jgi:NAD(P)-dependent dehydrogenase (short-subunit alcohol dehydrogenase family)
MPEPEPDPTQLALVTGAASGIGRHAALTLAARGFTVAALDLAEPGLSALAREHPRILPLVCDVSDQNDVRRGVEHAVGERRVLRTVVHCAGISPLGALLDQPASEIEHTMRVNYLGTVHVAKATVPLMIARGRGAFIAMASIAGHIPLTRIGGYSASKAAVLAFCEVLAAECRGTGVRFVCVCPAAVETPMLQTLRLTHPETINGKPGIPPAEVLRAAEASLRSGRPLAFPGRGTATLWRARRIAPTRLTRLLEIAIKRQARRRPRIRRSSRGSVVDGPRRAGLPARPASHLPRGVDQQAEEDQPRRDQRRAGVPAAEGQARHQAPDESGGDQRQAGGDRAGDAPGGADTVFGRLHRPRLHRREVASQCRKGLGEQDQAGEHHEHPGSGQHQKRGSHQDQQPADHRIRNAFGAHGPMILHEWAIRRHSPREARSRPSFFPAANRPSDGPTIAMGGHPHAATWSRKSPETPESPLVR